MELCFTDTLLFLHFLEYFLLLFFIFHILSMYFFFLLKSKRLFSLFLILLDFLPKPHLFLQLTLHLLFPLQIAFFGIQLLLLKLAEVHLDEVVPGVFFRRIDGLVDDDAVGRGEDVVADAGEGAVVV